MLNKETIKALFENDKEILTVKEIKEKAGEDLKNISSIQLACYLRNLYDIQVIEGKPCKYKLYENIEFTGNIKKEKNILKMELVGGNYIQYDFNKNTFIGDIVPNIHAKGTNENVVLRIFCDDYYSSLRNIEWLYNYIDLLDYEICWNCSQRELQENFKTCPQGYIKYIQDNDLKINEKSLKLFKQHLTYKNIPMPILKSFTSSYKNYTEDIYNILNTLFGETNFEKVLKNSLKKYELDIKNNLFDFVETINKYKTLVENWKNVIDTNRTLEENQDIIINIAKNLKNMKLNENLKKLNFLNGIIFNDYIVVIPQTVQDLENEGKQQNNCVGYHYNDSIAKGENLIYFLRKKDNANKSVVTCRYNLAYKETAEHRIKNNSCTNEEQNEIIKKIDRIIKKVLTI